MRAGIPLLFAILFARAAPAQSPPDPFDRAGTAPLPNALFPIAISSTDGMNFGQVIAGSSGGTVTLAPSGIRTATGGVQLGSGTSVSVATFHVTGDPLASYAVVLPSSDITLSSGSGSMSVTAFTSNPNGTGNLGLLGSQTLRVGATLQVGANQAGGTYSGTFDVTVSYD